MSSDSDYLIENGYRYLVEGNIPSNWGDDDNRSHGKKERFPQKIKPLSQYPKTQEATSIIEFLCASSKNSGFILILPQSCDVKSPDDYFDELDRIPTPFGTNTTKIPHSSKPSPKGYERLLNASIDNNTLVFSINTKILNNGLIIVFIHDSNRLFHNSYYGAIIFHLDGKINYHITMKSPLDDDSKVIHNILEEFTTSLDVGRTPELTFHPFIIEKDITYNESKKHKNKKIQEDKKFIAKLHDEYIDNFRNYHADKSCNESRIKSYSVFKAKEYKEANKYITKDKAYKYKEHKKIKEYKEEIGMYRKFGSSEVEAIRYKAFKEHKNYYTESQYKCAIIDYLFDNNDDNNSFMLTQDSTNNTFIFSTHKKKFNNGFIMVFIYSSDNPPHYYGVMYFNKYGHISYHKTPKLSPLPTTSQSPSDDDSQVIHELLDIFTKELKEHNKNYTVSFHPFKKVVGKKHITWNVSET